MLERPFVLTADSLEDGNFHLVNVPTANGSWKVHVMVFRFDRGVTSLKDVIARMAEGGCRPASRRICRAFYERYPSEKDRLLENFIGVKKTS